MTINILIYGIYRSIIEKRNMFPTVLKELNAKADFINLEVIVNHFENDDETDDDMN